MCKAEGYWAVTIACCVHRVPGMRPMVGFLLRISSSIDGG